MESEEFYDSLEDSSSEYGSVEGTSTTKTSENSFNSELPDDSIPFYDRNLSRSEITLEKHESQIQDLCASKKSWSSNKRLFRQTKRQPRKSYLEMFYARIGIVPANTARQTSLSFSPRSFITCDDYSLDSFYQKSDMGSTTR